MLQLSVDGQRSQSGPLGEPHFTHRLGLYRFLAIDSDDALSQKTT